LQKVEGKKERKELNDLAKWNAEESVKRWRQAVVDQITIKQNGIKENKNVLNHVGASY